jgi:hypothetical protein
MTSDAVSKQIETCSNAIVAFAVLQSLAYAYAFGTNAFFNCVVKTASHLAEGLTLLFALVMLLSIAAMVGLGNALKTISGEFRAIVAKIHAGKLVTVIVFSLVPLVLTFAYGVRDYPAKAECKKAT